MKKVFLIFFSIFFIIFIFSIDCSSDLVKNTVWEGAGYNKDDTSMKYVFDEVIFRDNGTISIKIRLEGSDINETYTGTYAIDSYEKLNFSGALTGYSGKPDDQYTSTGCLGNGTLSYYNGFCTGTMKKSTDSIAWRLYKVAEF
jgi:hypothetical protein